MCGIVGFVTHKSVMKKLMMGLQTLEYRGYDSAGVAIMQNNQIITRKAVGKLVNLANSLQLAPLDSNIAIGHTRWATHGGATENNAHPHVSSSVVVVHNGIIENFACLRDELEEQGFKFKSQTDTEVISHLIQFYYDQSQKTCSDRLKSLQQSFNRLKGAFAVVVCFSDAPTEMFAFARGSPLSFGVRNTQSQDQKVQNEYYIASDPLAFSQWVEQMCHLSDNQILHICQGPDTDSYDLYDMSLNKIQVKLEQNSLSDQFVNKGSFAHFMLKEINEQPRAILDTLAHVMSLIDQRKESLDQYFNKARETQLNLIACGTSYHACLVAKYFFEKYARISTTAELASEFLYRSPVLKGNYCFVSQSGETRDTIAAHDMVSNQYQTMAIVNVPTSQLARKANIVLTTQAGPEIGVASTKAFTSQLVVYLALCMSQISDAQTKNSFKQQLTIAATTLGEYLQFHTTEIQQLAQHLSKYKSMTYLGRGASFPIALEGALKLKEICYIHAEGYAAGELKHGPIALIDEQMPVVVFVSEENLEKIMSNVQEVLARNGKCIVVLNSACRELFDESYSSKASRINSQMESPILDQLQKLSFLVTPKVGEVGDLFFQSVVLQMLAYYTALELGVDVDQPRNLAKCVTVE
ncbi:Glutamine--fructose-6-phosphate_aminotransferase [isomerizing] 2..1840 Trepomonas PC1 GDID01000167 [Hexamita inflata]|uniref:glutamine--fructose-6-phosphate transaminase (isomerizing) n=1 Tax=Hexamita inflata TaxID=28002 RepID=A0AA86N9B8_9EUKA|nr:Glutamine--fructose-6-phosphate aminotransferase [isomerizing] 2..1840 Trepomonas PC1 GDID01000167 [Hexamita inflata]